MPSSMTSQAPLRAMQTYAQTVLEEEGESFDKAAREFMTLVVDAATRMESLSQRVLDYRRVVRARAYDVPGQRSENRSTKCSATRGRRPGGER